ncbi:MAG: chemotaxis protein CheB, partial [Burkholderiales bacterium]|nr:chemotaxis protein CheB [Burkholderiales bacterium]
MSSADLDVAFAEPQVDFPVVGLGASAGGLRALMEFFRHVDARSGAAYVVIVHLSPDHESSAPQLLQGVTVLPVAAVTERTAIRPNRVYVISPKSELDMNDGHLEFAASGPKRPSFTIDRFFITLAKAHRNRSVCVVLSGTGSDGTIGAKAVKAGGGVVIAQAPEDAEYDAMPRNAIASGAVDFALPAAAIPGRLAAIWQSAKHIE